MSLYIPMKSSNGITLVPLETRLLMERKIYIQGEINDQSACFLQQQLQYLVLEDPEKPVHLYIDSIGGQVDSGLRMYDLLKSLRMEVTTWCTGMAASMAAILLAGGQKGRRFILPHSRVMIHEPLITGGVGGSATSIQRTAESILETKRLAVKLLAADTGKSQKAVEQAISFDNYMNAEEAVKFGLCDAVVSEIQ